MSALQASGPVSACSHLWHERGPGWLGDPVAACDDLRATGVVYCSQSLGASERASMRACARAEFVMATAPGGRGSFHKSATPLQVFGCFLKQKRTLPAPTEGERRASEPVHKRQRTAPAATPLKDHQATGSASFQRRNKPVGSGFVFRDPNLSHSVDRIVAHPPRRPEKENGHPAAAQRSLSFQGSVHEAHAGIIAASPGFPTLPLAL